MTVKQQKQSRVALQIASRNGKLGPAAAALIRRHARKLDSFDGRIVACRVMVDTPHRHLHQGVRHAVRVDVAVPGAELVGRKAHLDLETAIGEAFDAVERRLKDHARVRRVVARSAARRTALAG